MVLLNVAHDGIGDKGKGPAGGDSRADVAGGDLEGVAGAEVGQQFVRPGGREMQVGGFGGMAGAGEGNEADERKQFQGLVPGVELGEGVGTDDEDEFDAGMKGLQVADGIEGVGCSGALEFNGEGFEAGFAGDGEMQHGQAVFVGGETGGGLVGRNGAGDEPDGVEIEETQGFAGDGEVSLVHGVEGAAEQSDGAGRIGQGRGDGISNITGSFAGARGTIWPTTTTGMSLFSTQYSRPRMEMSLPT